MSKILMVNPPFYRLLGSRYNSNQLGIAYVASYLNVNGHDAWVFNADYVAEAEYKNLQALFRGYHDYKKYFENPNHPIWEEVIDKVVRFNPDFVGWFCYTASVPTIKILSKKLYEKLPGTIQVVGGPHSSMDRELLNRMPYVHYACVREGEEVMLKLVSGEDPKTIQGLTSRTPQGLHYTGTAPFVDRNSLPFPERDKFWGLTEEEKLSVDVSYIIRTVGCSWACTYCASPMAWGRKVQMRSNESVIDEVKHLVENYWNREKKYDYSASANTSSKDNLVIKDNSIIYFVDDIFPLKKREFIPLMDDMIKEKLNAPWKCEARADLLDYEVCSKMKEAGCKMIKIGFETGSERILKQIKKGETREDFFKAAKVIQETGLEIGMYLIAAFPNEQDEDLDETIDLAKKLYDMGIVRYISLSVLSPYYGTSIYRNLLEQGYNLDDDNNWKYFYHQSPKSLINTSISERKLQEFLDLSKLSTKDYL